MGRLEAGFVEHPLNRRIEQDGVVQVGDFAVEPEVNAGDGRVLELSEVGVERLAAGILGQGGQERGHGLEGKREDDGVGGDGRDLGVSGGGEPAAIG